MLQINQTIEKISEDIQLAFGCYDTECVKFAVAEYALRAVYDKTIQVEAETINRIGQIVDNQVKEKFLVALDVMDANLILAAVNVYLEGNKNAGA